MGLFLLHVNHENLHLNNKSNINKTAKLCNENWKKQRYKKDSYFFLSRGALWTHAGLRRFRNTFSDLEFATTPDRSRVLFVFIAWGLERTSVSREWKSCGRRQPDLEIDDTRSRVGSLHLASSSFSGAVLSIWHHGRLTFRGSGRLALHLDLTGPEITQRRFCSPLPVGCRSAFFRSESPFRD